MGCPCPAMVDTKLLSRHLVGFQNGSTYLHSHETSYESFSCLSFWFLVVFTDVSQGSDEFVCFFIY